MFTSQIKILEATFADEGNVSLRHKPALNEIIRSPIPIKQTHKLSLFNWSPNRKQGKSGKTPNAASSAIDNYACLQTTYLSSILNDCIYIYWNVAHSQHLIEVIIQHTSYFLKLLEVLKISFINNIQPKFTPHLKAPIIRSRSLEGIVDKTSRNLTVQSMKDLVFRSNRCHQNVHFTNNTSRRHLCR
ncbi:hypothetical protein CDAR_269581 [Caerostris darwini]|uniref:Uncharacterized protein n=1 Tax=Caerostris darwini TaxID=1538125 RepID=A0AAV4WM98_9ARAC|nr:hypothetical protein CDAR_269581 [Caerostris darwini]